MRVEGKMMLREIADTLGVSMTTVAYDIDWILAHESPGNVKTVAQARQLQEQRLDLYLKEAKLALEAADSPKEKANILQVLLKLDERRAKLLGLDAPIRQEIETTAVGEVTPADARAAMARHFSNSAVAPDESN
jgi:Trp operon repressor